MAAFKRPGTKYFWIGPFRAGAVDVPRMSTGQTNKGTARSMEEALKNRSLTGYADLVRQVADRAVPLAEFYTAHVRGPEALDELRARGNDPLLHGVLTRVDALITDPRARSGLDELRKRTNERTRLSWLRDPKNLTQLYADALATGRKPNTVRRSLHRAVSEVLTHEIGRGQMLAVMADAKVPSARDERVVLLSIAEIRRALELADAEFRPVLGLAVTTGIDQGPIQALRDADYDVDEGTLRVSDTKTATRPRSLMLRGEPVLENAEVWLGKLRLWVDEPNELLVPLTDRQIRTRWESIRAAIGRTDVRWKDLRGIFATYYLQAGGDPRTLQHVMGHATMSMTLRYLRRLPVGSKRHVSEAAKRVGLLNPTLKALK